MTMDRSVSTPVLFLYVPEITYYDYGNILAAIETQGGSKMKTNSWLVVSLAGLLASCGGQVSEEETQAGAISSSEHAVTSYRLLVGVGQGHGAITSTPALINCRYGSCSYTVTAGTVLTLHGAADSTYAFLGWGSTAGSTADLTVTMNANKGPTMAYFNCVPGSDGSCGCQDQFCCENDACDPNLSCYDVYGYGQNTCQ